MLIPMLMLMLKLMLSLMPMPAGVGPFWCSFLTRSPQTGLTGQPRRQAGMPFRFLVPSSRRSGWFCAMTPRAATCHSLRHAALGTAL